jgi:hypothetical protein
MYKDRKRYYKNGYVVVNVPGHPKAFDATGDKNPESYCVYEHVLIAEEILDRSIKEGEVVHHLDENRANNSPDNLLVLSNPMHVKLHGWLNKHEIIPNAKQEKRLQLGCVRCGICEKPIEGSMVYCSVTCAQSSEAVAKEHKYEHPTKEQLEKLVWSKSTVKIASELGVSDVAVAKLCKKLNVDKPPRGYWAKVEAGLICPLE